MKTHAVPRLSAVALLALAMVGCTTPATVVQSPSPKPTTPISTPETPAYTLSETTEAIRVALDVAAADDASADLAAGVRETAVTALRDRKFRLVSGDPCDLSLSMSARQAPFDETAGFVSLDGTVSARLSDAATGGVLAEKTFRGRNKAVLGTEAATAALSEVLRQDVAGWINGTVTPDQIPLEARTFRVKGVDRHPGGESAFVNDFVRAVSGMKGVLRCETAARDPKQNSVTFRILFRRADYPQGFVHAAIAENPQFGLVLE